MKCRSYSFGYSVQGHSLRGGGGKGGNCPPGISSFCVFFKLIIPKINTGIATWYLLRSHCPPPPRIWARLRPCCISFVLFMVTAFFDEYRLACHTPVVWRHLFSFFSRFMFGGDIRVQLTVRTTVKNVPSKLRCYSKIFKGTATFRWGLIYK